ncbi:MAG TPA: hypothetical protein VGN17_18685 [Bryobacteraceae bacterium]|jgi:hypothetical protein
MLTQKTLIAALVLAAATASHAYASACSNPCTGSSAAGVDSTDRTNFNADNSDLTFSNITFDNATGTYDATTTGLNATTAPSASLFGVTFVGCLSTENPCTSNSTGLIVGNLASWDGGSDPNLQVNTTNFGAGHWDTITITLPANTYAFGIDIIDENNNSTGFPLLIHVDNTADKNSAGSVSLPGSVFFGYRSATPIGTVSIFPSTAAEQIAIDNLELGQQQAAATPEISTILLIGTGLFMVGYARRRKWLLVPRLA